MKTNIFKWLIIVLTLHIFSVMAGLLHGLNGKNESIWLAFLFAASYAVASAFVVYIAQKRWLIMCYAVADGIAVIFYYFSATPEALISIFFGVYTFGLIASTIYLSFSPAEMLKAGLKKSEVSKITDIPRHKL